jgi:hypothetical protein
MLSRTVILFIIIPPLGFIMLYLVLPLILSI